MRKRKKERATRIECEWFALCKNESITDRMHPILGPVPICDRCNERIERMKSGE